MVSTCHAAHPKAETGAGDGVEARFDTACETPQLRLFGGFAQHERLRSIRRTKGDSLTKRK
jgi:hypothetical protein